MQVDPLELHDIVSKLCLSLLLQDALESVVDLREADVPYHIRFCIDRDIRCGQWYTVVAKVNLSHIHIHHLLSTTA